MEATANMQVQPVCWFAARTRCGTELRVRKRLGEIGTEHFLPTEQRTRTRGKGKYEKALIPGMIFVRTTKTHACALPNEMGVSVKYLIDSATRTLLVVPDKQMDDFRRVLEHSLDEGGLMDVPLKLGDRVRVTDGPLAGVEGHVIELSGRTYVVVSLIGSWFAKASVPRAWLELVKEQNKLKVS